MENHNPHHAVVVTERLTRARYLGQFSQGRPSTHGSCRTYGLQTGKAASGQRLAICGTRAMGTVRSPNQARASLAFHRAPQARGHRSRLPAGPPTPAVSPPGGHTHTCLRPRTLAASGGEKGNALCFKVVFVSAGEKRPGLRKAWQRHFFSGCDYAMARRKKGENTPSRASVPLRLMCKRGQPLSDNYTSCAHKSLGKKKKQAEKVTGGFHP